MSDAFVDDLLLRLSEVERQTGLRKTAIYKRMGEGTFPRPKDLGGGAVRWRQSAITAWKDALPEVEYRALRTAPQAESRPTAR